jgi:4-hydroxy 2-oxovalerate aldolase
MGTYIPHKLKDKAFELNDVVFTDKLKDTHTALAIETARELGVNSLYFVGYDGYGDVPMEKKEQELFAENEYLFLKAKENGLALISLTASSYNQFEEDSVFAWI